METPVTISAVLLFCLFQTCAFQVPIRRSHNRELHEFRVPRANHLLKYMNQSVDPCVDFYEFACGNWANLYKPTEDTTITSPLEQLQEKVYREIQELLTENVTKFDGQAGRRVKDFYASCMNTVEASRTIRRTFAEFLKQNGGMPAVDRRWNEHNYSWLIQISNLRLKYGMDIIIGLEIKPDYQNPRESRIYIGEPSTLISKSLCKETEYDESQFEDLQKEVIENMSSWFGTGQVAAKTMAMEIFDFEITLCRGMTSSTEDLDVNLNLPRQTLAELSQQHPSIDFQYFVTTSLGQPIPQTVYMENDDYYKNLAKIIHTTSKRVIANYIMYRALVAINFPNEEDGMKRRSLCVQKCMTHFPKVVGELYHRKAFRTETVDDIEVLWDNIREAFRLDLNSQLWIEENTRRTAIYKLKGMQLMFPTYVKETLHAEYSTLRINRTQFWDNILNLLEMEQKQEVNKLYYGSARLVGPEIEAADISVGYNHLQNIIRMSLGLLQPPVYHRSAPTAYKFATLGFLIAHEIVHGFDEIGWYYDDTAAMHFWWDQNSTILYKEQVKCFKDQYVNYVGEEANIPAAELDEQIREIVADNGAVNISFNAYLMWLHRTVETYILHDETLSEVDYTNTQLFFISFAQNFCTAKYSEEPPVIFFPWDEPNRVEKFRVNGPLMNMDEFSREFNCLPGTEMNPGDKCVIY